ncbi:MAG: ComEC/Rec2 family competence protein [Elusimicrobia bacterium]|nr:ComEC/Rec2 family competence protein [Elusimicrobiota bacterium]
MSYPFRRPVILAVFLGSLALAALSFWEPFASSKKFFAGAVGRPALMIGRVQGYPSSTKGGDTFLLNTRWVRSSNGNVEQARHVVRVFRQRPSTPWTWGDEVSVWGIVGEAGIRSGPNVASTLFVPEGKSFLLKRLSSAHPLRWAAGLRAQFHRAFEKHLSPLHAQLMKGVLLGDRPRGLETLADDFRRSGLYHLLVASGSNVGFAVGVWWVFSRWVMWWPRRAALVGVPAAAFLYAAMAGGDPPVLRAAVMASFLAMGALFRRWDRPEQSLFFSAGLLLVLDPTRLFQAGFQMSYVATWAIVTVWRGRRSSDEGDRSFVGGRTLLFRAVRYVKELLTTSLAAQLALAPLLLYYFGTFSWVGIGANMVAVPLSGICLWSGAVLAFLDGAWPWAASIWAVPTEWIAQALMGWARLWAKIPCAQLHGSIRGAQTVALFAGIVAVFMALTYKRKRLSVPLIGLITASVAWGLAEPEPRNALDIVWRGGRNPSVQVQSETKSTVFEKKRSIVLPRRETNRVYWDEGSPPPALIPSSLGTVQCQYLSPQGGSGFAVLLTNETARVFLNFGLTSRQQSDSSVRSVGPVDGLSWASGKGGPPTDDLLAVLRPRWIVPLTRSSRSVRRCGAKVIFPGRDGIFWRADERGAGFVASKN